MVSNSALQKQSASISVACVNIIWTQSFSCMVCVFRWSSFSASSLILNFFTTHSLCQEQMHQSFKLNSRCCTYIMRYWSGYPTTFIHFTYQIQTRLWLHSIWLCTKFLSTYAGSSTKPCSSLMLGCLSNFSIIKPLRTCQFHFTSAFFAAVSQLVNCAIVSCVELL